MAAFVKSDGHYLCSASMERFLRLLGNRIMSQPIKGTRGRSVEMASDQALKLELSLSLKDRAENVMIVDLVRNDLARVCETGSIAVPELFGVYTFEHVHQMISTVEGILKPEMKLPDILRATFPMGSMTGTPKIAAMKHIEYLEDFKRSWYAGSAGYIKPGGDFDLNVIIRSLCYNHETEMISYASGGAITIDSRPEEEWEECLVKARAIEGILFDKGIVSL
jgi:para-aminobenzoate synthetase component 1